MPDWRRHWSEVPATPDDSVDAALRQVGKTVMGRPIDHAQLSIIVTTIVDSLELGASDHVLDLGCGNGLITAEIAPNVAAVCAVDISEILVADAAAHRASSRISYVVADLAAGIDAGVCPHEPTAAYSYEVLQHLDEDETVALLRSLRPRVGAGFRCLLASIPDHARLRNFYDSPERWERYLERRRAGTEQIGTWWQRDRLVELAARCGFDCDVRSQAAGLYTSHYRFDAVLRPTSVR